jgi:hypothetical protein
VLSTKNVEYFGKDSHPEKYDPAIVVAIRHSDFRYIVHGDIYMDFLNTPEMARLQSIHQLGLINLNPLFKTAHTRSEHSIIASVMGETVATNND